MSRDIPSLANREQLRLFMKKLLNDVRAMEQMLKEEKFETGMRRIGVEQEIYLVDKSMRPAPIVMDLLKQINDEHFVTELGAFNVEFNSDTYIFGGDCLHRLEQEMLGRVAAARKAANNLDCDVMLVGILPSIQQVDLDIKNMAPVPRYHVLNDVMTKLRGEPYEFRITGMDELLMEHDTVMTEAACTSFQTHFQVSPKEFAELYNVSQVVCAPLLAASTNSPILFGKRLWAETRIALFQQSIDTRKQNATVRDIQPRVSFGTRWIDQSILEIYREDITRFRVLIGADNVDDPFEALARGEAPSLKALRLHNGTIYRWQRACYGITDGKPHLRIENRVLPAGPTVVDEVSNLAFWCGLMSSVSRHYQDVREHMLFDDAKANFLAAARLGLDAPMKWLDGERYTSKRLILDKLLPLAEEGLRIKKIRDEDIRRYLGVIEARVESGQTGSRWMIDTFAETKSQGTRVEQMATISAAMIEHQKDNTPVAEWPLAKILRTAGRKNLHAKVEQYMSTDIVTVNEEELVDLVACLMDWHRVRHVLVEDDNHALVGIISHRAILRLVARGVNYIESSVLPVKEIMQRNVVTITPDTTTKEAIALMQEKRISCLPVVRDGHLVGKITEKELIPIAGDLLESTMGQI